MGVFADGRQRRDPRLRHVYFDVATIITEGSTPGDGAIVAKRIREIGTANILYGSDLSPPGGSWAGWEIFRSKVPLTAAEFRAIERNRLPFVR
jgi:hypothetical protein